MIHEHCAEIPEPERSDLRDNSLASIPATVKEPVLGKEVIMCGEKLAQKVSAYIVENASALRKHKANIALALYLMHEAKLYLHEGCGTWQDYVYSMIERHHAFPQTRQSERYISSVSTWIIELGYSVDILAEFGPSVLGELSQAGAVTSQAEGDAWLEVIRNEGVVAVRRELKRNRAILPGLEKPQLPPPISAAETETVLAEAPSDDTATAVSSIKDDTPVEEATTPVEVLPPQTNEKPPYDEAEELTLDGIEKTHEAAQRIFLEVVEDQDDYDMLYNIRIFHGD